MPGGAPSRTPDDRHNRDIRDFISPPPSQKRRRRIIESSSSDEQRLDLQAGHHADAQPQLPPHVAANNENEHPEPIQIDSGSESSDSMYVARLQPAVALQERNGRAGTQSHHQVARPQQEVALQERNIRAIAQSRQQPAPLGQRRTSPQQQLLARRQRRGTPQRQLRHAEAESTSEEESTGLSADESDQNAADLYRAAILGVRNRPNAAQQVISNSTNCIAASYINS